MYQFNVFFFKDVKVCVTGLDAMLRFQTSTGQRKLATQPGSLLEVRCPPISQVNHLERQCQDFLRQLHAPPTCVSMLNGQGLVRRVPELGGESANHLGPLDEVTLILTLYEHLIIIYSSSYYYLPIY